MDPFEHLPVMMELKHDLCSTPAEMLRVCSKPGGGGRGESDPTPPPTKATFKSVITTV